MSRRPHILRGNRGVETAHSCIWVDTETRGELREDGAERHVLWFGYAAYRRRLTSGQWSQPSWLRFESIDSFWLWALAKLRSGTKTYLFAHNAAFDLPVLDAFNRMMAEGWTLKSSVIDSPPVILAWRKAKQSLTALDTLNIWRMPLHLIGKSIGLPKLTMPSASAPRSDWDTYGRRDVEIIMEVCLRWFNFLTEQDLGGFAPTLASQAFRAYRHRFMSVPILIDDSAPANEMVREGYHGGRVECFRLGRVVGPLYLVDVNSMYPYVMSTEPMPYRLVSYRRWIDQEDLQEWMTHGAAVAEVSIETDEPDYPVVHEHRLVFPIGRLRLVLCGAELRHAMLAGRVRRVHRAALYEHAALFSAYVAEIYALRLRLDSQGDGVGAWCAKLLLNSLYGKFGQGGRVWEMFDSTPDLEIKLWLELDGDTGEAHQMRQFGGVIQRLLQEGEARDSHPAIAAHVTASARYHLAGLIRRAGRQHCHYCDTDSLLLNETGYQRLTDQLHSSQLGKLKLERVLAYADIRGPKDYDFDGLVKVKGVKSQARWIEPDLVEQPQFSSLVGLLREGDLSAPIVRTVRKRLARLYTKGVVQPSGDVLPLQLSHW